MRAALIAALLLAPLGTAAAKPDCRAPRKSLAAFTKRAMAAGDNNILGEAPAKASGGLVASRQLIFDGAESMSYSVLVVPGTGPDELTPAKLFLTRMIITDAVKERQFYRATLSGRLEEAAFLYDRYDENQKSLGTDLVQMLAHDPRAYAGFEKMLKDICRKFASGDLSIGEQKAAVERKIKALEARREKRQP